MIPATRWTDGGYGTAWLVVECPPDSAPAVWEQADKPCDTCGGSGVIDTNHFGDRMMIEPCVKCDGTGHHTFTVEVEDDNPLIRVRSWTHRVSVVPGMVLPIVDYLTPEIIANKTPCLVRAEESGSWLLWRGDGERITSTTTLPPAAAPGVWAIQLRKADR